MDDEFDLSDRRFIRKAEVYRFDKQSVKLLSRRSKIADAAADACATLGDVAMDNGQVTLYNRLPVCGGPISIFSIHAR